MVPEIKGNCQERSKSRCDLTGQGAACSNKCSYRAVFPEKDQIQDISCTDTDSLFCKLGSCGYKSFFPGKIIAANAGMNCTDRNCEAYQAEKIRSFWSFQYS